MTFSHDDTSDPSTASAVIKGVSKAPEGISAWRGFPPFLYLTPPSGCVLAVLAHCSFPLLRQLAVTKGTSDVPVGILRTAVTHQRAICAEQLFSTLRRLQETTQCPDLIVFRFCVGHMSLASERRGYRFYSPDGATISGLHSSEPNADVVRL